MAVESLADVVRSLTPQEQDAVRQFIDYLKRREEPARSDSAFLHAAEEFIAQHPELLRSALLGDPIPQRRRRNSRACETARTVRWNGRNPRSCCIRVSAGPSPEWLLS